MHKRIAVVVVCVSCARGERVRSQEMSPHKNRLRNLTLRSGSAISRGYRGHNSLSLSSLSLCLKEEEEEDENFSSE